MDSSQLRKLRDRLQAMRISAKVFVWYSHRRCTDRVLGGFECRVVKVCRVLASEVLRSSLLPRLTLRKRKRVTGLGERHRSKRRYDSN